MNKTNDQEKVRDREGRPRGGRRQKWASVYFCSTLAGEGFIRKSVFRSVCVCARDVHTHRLMCGTVATARSHSLHRCV